MSIPIEKVLNRVSKKRQKAIRKKAEEYIKEYTSLQELRKALGITQNMLADRQGISQVNISNLEKRTDMQISTLKRYVEAMGCKLEIFIRTPDKTRARVKGLF